MSKAATKNNIGSFFTNLGKNSNITKNANQVLNSLIPLANNKQNNKFNVFDETMAPSENPSFLSKIDTLFWPIIIFIIVLILIIIIYRANKHQIDAGFYNLGQFIRGIFSENQSPLKTGETTTHVTQGPIPPQTDTNDNNISIIDKLIPLNGEGEVFNINKNAFTFYDAEPLCEALGAELATYDQVKEAWSKGADWCNYGWVKGQAAVYPTQKETYNRLQSGPDENKGSCGVIGLNGGYFDNPEMKFGVNCYGVKPEQKNHDQEMLMKEGNIPLSVPALEIDKKVQEFRAIIDTIDINPFNHGKWAD